MTVLATCCILSRLIIANFEGRIKKPNTHSSLMNTFARHRRASLLSRLAIALLALFCTGQSLRANDSREQCFNEQ